LVEEPSKKRKSGSAAMEDVSAPSSKRGKCFSTAIDVDEHVPVDGNTKSGPSSDYEDDDRVKLLNLINSYNATKLKSELRLMNKSTVGTKKDLAKRLLQAKTKMLVPVPEEKQEEITDRGARQDQPNGRKNINQGDVDMNDIHNGVASIALKGSPCDRDGESSVHDGSYFSAAEDDTNTEMAQLGLDSRNSAATANSTRASSDLMDTEKPHATTSIVGGAAKSIVNSAKKISRSVQSALNIFSPKKRAHASPKSDPRPTVRHPLATAKTLVSNDKNGHDLMDSLRDYYDGPHTETTGKDASEPRGDSIFDKAFEQSDVLPTIEETEGAAPMEGIEFDSSKHSPDGDKLPSYESQPTPAVATIRSKQHEKHMSSTKEWVQGRVQRFGHVPVSWLAAIYPRLFGFVFSIFPDDLFSTSTAVPCFVQEGYRESGSIHHSIRSRNLRL
jgi:hypothetical protein